MGERPGYTHISYLLYFFSRSNHVYREFLLSSTNRIAGFIRAQGRGVGLHHNVAGSGKAKMELFCSVLPHGQPPCFSVMLRMKKWLYDLFILPCNSVSSDLRTFYWIVSQSTIVQLFLCYTERNVNQCIVNRVRVRVRGLGLGLGLRLGFRVRVRVRVYNYISFCVAQTKSDNHALGHDAIDS